MPTTPTAPVDVTIADQGNQATVPGSETVLITWGPPQEAPQPITGYAVSIYQTETGDPVYLATINTNASANSLTTPVPAGHTYLAKVRALYEDGTSTDWTSSPTAITIPTDTRPPVPIPTPGPPSPTPEPPGPGGAPVAQVNTQQADARMVLILSQGGVQLVRIVLPINPEDLQIEFPSRSAVINTLAGAYQEAWGQGVGSITISGTTGWRDHHDGQGDGHQLMLALKNLHKTYQNLTATKDPATVDFRVILPPFAGQNAPPGPGGVGGQSQVVVGSPGQGQEGYYRCSSDILKILRNRASPLLYRYSWNMTILLDLMYPPASPSQRFSLTGQAAGGGGQGASTTVPTSQSTPTPATSQAGMPNGTLVAQPGQPYTVTSPQTVPDIVRILNLPAEAVGAILAANNIIGQGPLAVGTTIVIPKILSLIGQ